MSFSKFATSDSEAIDVPKISHCLASPVKVSALALKNEDSMNKEKHSLRNFAVLEIPTTSIVTSDTKEANFEN